MPAGVDHAGLLQHGQQGRGPGQGLGRPGPGRLGHRPPATRPRRRPAWPRSAAPRATVRMVPSTGRMTASRASWSAVSGPGPAPRGPGTARSGTLSPSDRPRSSWERMTPELPRAPISEPWAMARQAAARSGDSSPASLGGDRLQGEGHVGAGVAVGHRVDIEPVDELLVAPQAVPEGADDTAELRCIQASRATMGRMLTFATYPEVLRGSRSVMAAVCEVCGKKPSFGMNISHSHRRTKRRWDPNIQQVRAVVDGAPKRLNVCTSCIRSGKVTKRPIRNIPA